MALITISDCKAFRGIENDVQEHDDELGRLITAAQSWLEQECGRVFDSATVTEYYNGNDWSDCVVLRRPITSITNIWDDPYRTYGSTTLLDSTKYVIGDAEAGIVLLDGLTFQQGLRNIKITYVGGYASTDATLTPLKQALIEMVWAAREKGQHNLVGVRSRSIADGNVQFVNLDWGSMNLKPIIQQYSLRTGVH
jgi:uncharacterized phiE125 gp8 family phage protein